MLILIETVKQIQAGRYDPGPGSQELIPFKQIKRVVPSGVPGISILETLGGQKLCIREDMYKFQDRVNNELRIVFNSDAVKKALQEVAAQVKDKNES